MRLVADLIRQLPVEKALQQLEFSSRRAARPMAKLLKSAIANAENNNHLNKDNLFIKEIRVDQGSVLKRWRARAMGRAAAIRKRTSHISITLAEIEPSSRSAQAKKKTASQGTEKAENKKDVKIVSSLDEINASLDEQSKTSSHQPKAAIKEKSHGPSTTKRKFFSRKSG